MLLVPDRCLNALALREKHRHVLSKASPANCRRNLRWSVGRSRRSGDGQTSGVKILVEDQKLLIAERARELHRVHRENPDHREKPTTSKVRVAQLPAVSIGQCRYCGDCAA